MSRDSTHDWIVKGAQPPLGDESADYFAAEILVQGHRYSEAEIFLQQAERQIAENLSGYYRNCILLLDAYCAVKLDRRDLARMPLATVEDRDEKLFWLRTKPVISVGPVEALIAGESPLRLSREKFGNKGVCFV